MSKNKIKRIMNSIGETQNIIEKENIDKFSAAHT